VPSGLRPSMAVMAFLLGCGSALAQSGYQTEPVAAPAPDSAATDKAGEPAVPKPPADAALPPVETIISDTEFNAAIPALGADPDPELTKPLESIEAFERRLAGEQAGANPAQGQAAPAGVPALSDGTVSEQIGDAPVRDAELARPLLPLGEFKVEPVELGAAEAEKGNADVRYAVQINGLDAPDREAEADLAAEFRSLSALRAGHGKAENGAMLSARLTEDTKLIQQILAAAGWYGATVKPRIVRPAGDAPNEALTAVLDVTAGKRYTLSGIAIKAQSTVPPGLIEKNLALNIGEPIVAERVQGAEAQVAVALPQNGYAFAKVGDRDILLDADTGKGEYTLPVDVGPRGLFGGFATEGKLAFGVEHVGILARFKRGELYDSRKVDDLRQALVATGLFATVGVEPVRSGESAGDGTEYVTLKVEQQAGKPRTIGATLGYGSGEGARLEASWTHRNLFPPEGALIVHGIAGTKEQAAGVTFRRSNSGQRDRTLEIGAEALHSTFDAYSAYTGRLSARMSRDSTPLWQKRYTWAAGVQVLGTREQDFDVALGRRDYKTYFIAGLTGQFGVDFSNSLLDPTKGFRVTTLIEPEGSLRGSFTPYVRVRLDASAYYPVSDSFVMAGRLRFGTIQGASRIDLAPSRRFYAGGGGSVRGFAYQKLGPLDPSGDPLGGRSLTEGSAEVRYRFGDYGVVAFVDAGQAYASNIPKFSNLRYGVGLGGRFYTNFGPIRLDVATPLQRRANEGRLNIYVSIGQAF